MQNQKLPNATAVLILGIISIVTCCCYGIFGLIAGGVGLMLANKDMKLYQANPDQFSNFNNLKIGRILCIIGLILSALYLIYVIFLFSTLGMEGIQQMQEEMMRKYGAQ